MIGRSPVQEFEVPESFALYIQGLRALHRHEAEAGRRDGPRRPDELTKNLELAEDLLHQCVDLYPRDLLPRYYYAIVRTLRGQAAQARQLAHDIEGHRTAVKDYETAMVRHQDTVRSLPEGTPPPAPPVAPVFRPSRSRDAERAYADAERHFSETAKHAPDEMVNYAAYNEAQALGNLAQAAGLDEVDTCRQLLKRARAAVDRVKPANQGKTWATTLNVRPSWAGVKRWLRKMRSTLTGASHSASSSPPPRETPAERSADEARALAFQVALLSKFIDHWDQMLSGRLAVGDFPTAREGDEPRVPDELRGLVPELNFNGLLQQAQYDLVAEYWNKWARLARARAQRASDPDETRRLLDLADGYYRYVILLRRPRWAPGRLNHAFVLALQGAFEAATEDLAYILGTPEPAAPAGSAPTDGADLVAFVLAMPFGTSAATAATLVNGAFGHVESSKLHALVQALREAKVDPRFIEDVVRALNVWPFLDPSEA